MKHIKTYETLSYKRYELEKKYITGHYIIFTKIYWSFAKNKIVTDLTFGRILFLKEDIYNDEIHYILEIEIIDYCAGDMSLVKVKETVQFEVDDSSFKPLFISSSFDKSKLEFNKIKKDMEIKKDTELYNL